MKNPNLINGVLFLSPAFRGNSESQPFMKKVGWVMGKILPKFLVVPQSFNQQTKRDSTERIQNDPYVYKDKVNVNHWTKLVLLKYLYNLLP